MTTLDSSEAAALLLTMQQLDFTAQADLEDRLIHAMMQLELEFDLSKEQCMAMFAPEADFQPVLPQTVEAVTEDVYDGPAVDLNAIIDSYLV